MIEHERKQSCLFPVWTVGPMVTSNKRSNETGQVKNTMRKHAPIKGSTSASAIMKVQTSGFAVNVDPCVSNSGTTALYSVGRMVLSQQRKRGSFTCGKVVSVSVSCRCK